MIRPLAALLLCLAALPAAAASLTVKLEGLRTGAGPVKVGICRNSFEAADCPWGAVRAVTGASLEVSFDIPPGSYAVAAYQDIDGNGELDKVPPGIPTEPYAFSNDVGRLGPPRFENAAIAVGPERTVLSLRLRRLLGG